MKYKTDKERLANCPAKVDAKQWKWLVKEHWGTKKFRVSTTIICYLMLSNGNL